MTSPYKEMYKRKVSKIEEQMENIKLFPCKISHIVETSIRINDAIEKAESAYTALPSQTKKEEDETYRKSMELIKKYREIMLDIDNRCDCTQRSSLLR